jgi:hypothetical protein
VRGVAPDVTFSAYRVFGCSGATATDVMLAAMERVYRDGADVLNMQLGTRHARRQPLSPLLLICAGTSDQAPASGLSLLGSRVRPVIAG